MDKKHALEVLKYSFSVHLLKSLIYSVGYYIHERVAWRGAIHRKKSARIHATASIRNAHNVYVGENSHINHQCCIWAGDKSKIVLGDNLLMGPGVKMFAGNHGTKKGIPMNQQPREEKDIIIGNDVWLGAGVVVLGGVEIADGVIVAAGSSVTRPIKEENAIIGGNPAEIKGYRR